MYIEYACLDYTLPELEVNNRITYAVKHGIKNIVVFHYGLNALKSQNPDANIYCPIDYPYGLSDLKSRQYLVEQVAKSGVKGVDITAPGKILTNRKYDKLREDIKANVDICQSLNIELRYVLEYRMFSHEVLAKVCQILKTFNVHTVLPSSGTFLDDINDNLIACNFLNTKSDIKTICNGNVFLAKHIESVMNSKTHGLRLYHQNSIDILAKLIA